MLENIYYKVICTLRYEIKIAHDTLENCLIFF